MLSEESSLYEIYVHFFGITKSGTKVRDEDFCFKNLGVDQPFTSSERISAVLGISDVKDLSPMKTISEFVKSYEKILNQ